MPSGRVFLFLFFFVFSGIFSFPPTFSGLLWPGSFFPSFRLWIPKRCKGVHCVDLGESFPTRIYLQKSASIQPRTSPYKFARSPRTDPPGPALEFESNKYCCTIICDLRRGNLMSSSNILEEVSERSTLSGEKAWLTKTWQRLRRAWANKKQLRLRKKS